MQFKHEVFPSNPMNAKYFTCILSWAGLILFLHEKCWHLNSTNHFRTQPQKIFQEEEDKEKEEDHDEPLWKKQKVWFKCPDKLTDCRSICFNCVLPITDRKLRWFHI